MPRTLRLAALVVLATGLVSACATPAPAPLVMSGTFADRGPQAGDASAPAKADTAPGCRVQVVALTDARRAPEIMGVIAGRAIKSPPDTKAWMRSILSGLGARGVEVDFPEPGPAAPDAVQARVSLVTAWITSVTLNLNAGSVLRLSAARPGRPPLERDYRGGVSRLNWTGGADEMQRLVDLSFTEALDGMAADLRGLCADGRADGAGPQ